MAGFVALGDNKYIGTLTFYSATSTDTVENGLFVTPDFANGRATIVADDTAGDGDVYFVVNEIDTVAEEAKNDVDYATKVGDFLKLKVPQKGEIFVTTKYKGTPAKGDVLAVGDGGSLEAVVARTPKFKFAVKELTTYLGQNALKVVVL